MPPGPCEYCHRRQKFGTHKYCGKTCASKAATNQVSMAHAHPRTSNPGQNRAVPTSSVPQKAVQLCKHCGGNSRFKNSDYCTKTCASLANPVQSHQATAQAKNPPRPNVMKAAHPKAPVCQVPATTSDDDDDATDAETETDLDVYPSESEEEEPSVPIVKPGKNGASSSRPSLNTCALPHCGKPVHVDKAGMKTQYCGTKHREDAVTLGLEAPCIMCKRYPQSDSTYFCSSACRTKSMSKT